MSAILKKQGWQLKQTNPIIQMNNYRSEQAVIIPNFREQGITEMKVNELPTHVFLSYSRENEIAVGSICFMLEQSHIPYWVDKQKLLPGTPDWEESIRRAIQSAYCVVILCSPQSRKSQFVRAELSIAEYYNTSILPVWVEGDSWIDSVPMSLASTQHIDIRDSNYEHVCSTLCLRLKAIIQASKPKHAVIGDSLVDNSPSQFQSRSDGFSDYITVFLDMQENEVVVFDPEAYSSTQSLLDDLYMNYLFDRTEPSSYGKEWLLVGRGQVFNPGRIVAPWSYLEFLWEKELIAYDMQWAELSLKEYGLGGGSVWEIKWKKDIRTDESGSFRNYDQPIGLAVNSDALLEAVMFGGGKQPAMLERAGYLSEIEFQGVDPREFRHTIVIQNAYAQQGRIVKETDKPFDLKKYDPYE